MFFATPWTGLIIIPDSRNCKTKTSEYQFCQPFSGRYFYRNLKPETMKKSILFLFVFIGFNSFSQWVYQSSGTTEDLFAVHFPTVNKGYAVGNNGVILQTTTGGTAWNSLNSGTNAHFYSVFFRWVFDLPINYYFISFFYGKDNIPYLRDIFL